MALGVVGAGLLAAGAVAGGIEAGQAASYQAQVARNNAIIASQNAQRSASAAAANTEAAGLKARQQLAGLTAATAANGLDTTSGSPEDTKTSEHEVGQLNTATQASNAALQVYGYESQATNFNATAGLEANEAAYDPIAGVIKGAGGLLSNSSVDNWLDPPSSGGSSDSSIGPPTSLLSGAPSVPPQYSWMQNTDLTSPNPSSGGLY